MTLDEAVKLWVNRDFSNIPTELVKIAFKDSIDDLELLTSEYPELDYPAGWGTMFHPEWSLDEEWIKENITEVEKCGFLVYDSEETGVLLGVDGCGYDFYSEHRKPLYRIRGLQWHEEKAAAGS